MKAAELLDLIRQAVASEPDRVALGTIDEGYVSGLPTVRFDDEDTASPRARPHLSSYAPSAGDRVLLVRAGAGQGWVILGAVTNT